MRFNIGKFVGLASQPERASLNGRMFRAQEREEALPWMLKYFSDILRTLGRGCSHKRLDGCSQKLALTWGHLWMLDVCRRPFWWQPSLVSSTPWQPHLYDTGRLPKWSADPPKPVSDSRAGKGHMHPCESHSPAKALSLFDRRQLRRAEQNFHEVFEQWLQRLLRSAACSLAPRLGQPWLLQTIARWASLRVFLSQSPSQTATATSPMQRLNCSGSLRWKRRFLTPYTNKGSL